MWRLWGRPSRGISIGDIDMQRGAAALAGAAILCGVLFLVLRQAVALGIPLGDLILVVAASTLMLAVGSAAFSWRAAQRSHQAHAEIARLARSIDAALGSAVARATSDGARGGTGRAPAAEAQQEHRALPVADVPFLDGKVVPLSAASRAADPQDGGSPRHLADQR